ncbi:P-loop containing nucleoside triphosphate hydrolase protein [Nemania abortiva]|nr:P-loop containing nucleoside triphosphate hydrolase protein [Nemania abortiva]
MADRSYVEPDYQIPGSPARAVRILVVGVTGSGKSTFVSQATGRDVGIGHDGDSCTQVCKSYYIPHDIDRTQFELIDTPGFDDPHKRDFDVLKDISESLDGVSGVVYCHPITDTKLIGDSKLNLEIIKAMCGRRFYNRIVICSTMWDTFRENVTHQQLEKHRTRMEHLLGTGLRDLMEEGAKYMEFQAEKSDSYLSILQSFSSLRFPPKMAILEQLSRRRNVQDTDSGQVIEEEHKRREAEGNHRQQASLKARDAEHKNAPKKQQQDYDYGGRDSRHAYASAKTRDLEQKASPWKFW